MTRQNILNIAHRGYTRAFPDNTCEAFQAAIDEGFDGVELDVRETADRRFVVYHDPNLHGKNIDRLSIGEIQGVKLNGKYEIPVLEKVLDICRGKAKLVIELKQISSLDSLLKILNKKTAPDDIIVASFKRKLVEPLRLLAPRIKTALITDRPVRDPVKLAGAAQCPVIIARFPSLNQKLIQKIRSGNFTLYIWGCCNPGEIRDALEYDIDGIISDFPNHVVTELRS